MAVFEVEVLDSDGNPYQTRVEAADARTVELMAHEKGYFPVRIKEVNPFARREDDEVTYVEVEEDTPGQQPDGTYYFPAIPTSDWVALMGFGGAALGIGGGLVGFVIALLTDVGQFQLHTMSTMPMIAGFFSLIGAIAMTRKRHSVRMDDQSIHIRKTENDINGKFSWDEIAYVKEDLSPYAGKFCKLIGYDGKTLATISQHYQDADSLFSVIEEQVEKHARPDADEVKQKGDRKTALFAVIFGSLFLCVCGFIAYMTYEDSRQSSLLASESVNGTATIEELKVAPNGSTKRLHYKIQLDDGNDYQVENVEVTDEYFEAMQGESEVPVIYAESDPNVSKLRNGQVVEDDFLKTPLGGYGLAGLCSLLSLFFITVGVLQLLGFDLGPMKL